MRKILRIIIPIFVGFMSALVSGVFVTNNAQIVEISKDLLEQVQTIHSEMPRADSEGFIQPTNEELANWRELITTMLEGNYELADTLVQANFPFYQLYRLTDTGYNSQLFYLLQEKFPVTKGWGTFIVNANFERQICIELPHAIYDTNTYSEGTDIFRRTGARFLIMAGTHRCADTEISPCDGSFRGCGGQRYPISDMAHFVDSPFQVTHETIDERFEDIYFFSIHGHGRDECEDIFLSNGHKTQSKPLLSKIKQSLLAQGGLTAAVAGDGTSSCTLVGSTNVQGRFTNGSADPCTEAASSINGYFIHAEQSRRVRDNFSVYSKFVNAINANIATVTSVEGSFPGHGANPPRTPTLFSMFPNPFHTLTTISYELSKPSRVSVRIYNLQGQFVRGLEQGLLKGEGVYQVQWDGTDRNGNPMPSGVYFIELESGKTLSRAKLIHLR